MEKKLSGFVSQSSMELAIEQTRQQAESEVIKNMAGKTREERLAFHKEQIRREKEATEREARQKALREQLEPIEAKLEALTEEREALEAKLEAATPLPKTKYPLFFDPYFTQGMNCEEITKIIQTIREAEDGILVGHNKAFSLLCYPSLRQGFAVSEFGDVIRLTKEHSKHRSLLSACTEFCATNNLQIYAEPLERHPQKALVLFNHPMVKQAEAEYQTYLQNIETIKEKLNQQQNAIAELENQRKTLIEA